MDVGEADDAHIHEDPNGLPQLRHADHRHLPLLVGSLDIGLLQQELKVVQPKHLDEDIDRELAVLHTPRPE